MADTEYIEYMLADKQIGSRTYRLASRAAGQGPRGYWHAGNDGTQRLLVQFGPRVQDGPRWSVMFQDIFRLAGKMTKRLSAKRK